jgi:hypothetical protein
MDGEIRGGHAENEHGLHDQWEEELLGERLVKLSRIALNPNLEYVFNIN